MNYADQISIEDAVSTAVRKRPGESIVDACKRIMGSPKGDPAWRVARIILGARPGADEAYNWRVMTRAAKAAARIARKRP
jgi:hypothetical protein